MAMHMICPYCGSQEPVYDYIHGYIVCSSCGSILDTLFIEFIEDRSEDFEIMKETGGVISVRRGIEKKKVKVLMRNYSRMRFEVFVYEKYAKKIKKDIVVDLDAALKREARVDLHTRVYHHKDEDKVLSILSKDPLVNKIFEHIVNSDPILSARTPRGKVALALIIRNIIENKPIDIMELSRLTSMSPVHIRRLAALVRKRMPYIKKRIDEIKTSVVLSNPI
jgi:transcription initiation factor TFIIIB Brf1 subunit/transcription initiation factor TFIIB